LTLRGEGFAVTLEGDEGFLRGAWRGLWPSIRGRAPEEARRAEEGGEGLRVQTCHALYEKVYVASRGEVGAGALGGVLALSRVKGVFVEYPLKGGVERLLGEPRLLWSRLTPAGRARLGVER
jgi:hypothetical protein